MEKDKRMYRDLFIPNKDYIHGFKKFRIILKSQKYMVKNFRDADRILFDIQNSNNSSSIISFKGMENLFKDINKYHDVVYKELLKITKEKHKKGLHHNFDNSISVHVRLGDFSENKRNIGKPCFRLPIDWYVEVVQTLRLIVGRECKVFVFSDGKEHELKKLLSLPNVEWLSFGSSIADLIALSRSNILVASQSTFSMWAAYLGRIPVIYYKKDSNIEFNSNLEVEVGESTEKNLFTYKDEIRRLFKE